MTHNIAHIPVGKKLQEDRSREKLVVQVNKIYEKRYISVKIIMETGCSRENVFDLFVVLLNGKMYRLRENVGIRVLRACDLLAAIREESFKLASIRCSSILFFLHPHLNSYSASKGMLQISL